MIKAITFDFWSTLYINRPVKLSDRLQFLKDSIEQTNGAVLEMDRLKQAVNKARTAWNIAWIEGYRTMGAAEWVSIVLDELDISLEEPEQAAIGHRLETRLLDAAPILVNEAKRVLPALAKRYRLAIISDTGLTPGWVLRQVLEQDQVAAYFTRFTFSDEVGCSKPHPNAFLSTLAALEVEPHQAVHIGDLLRTDIAGAQGVGMRAVQYVGVSTDRAEPKIRPHAVIGDHRELNSLLDQWRNRPGD